MTRVTIMLGLLMLAGTASAARTLELVEGAHEVTLAHLTLPGGTSGTVIFRSCETCDPHSLRVTSDTRYIAGDQTLPLTEFRDAANRIRQSGNDAEPAIALVFYDMETGRVTRIRLLTND